AGAAEPRELDHLGHLAARDALGDHHEELDARLDGLEDRVAGEARRHRDDRAVDVHLARDVAHAVVDGHAVDLAPGAARRHAAHDLRAVVEPLARQVDRLAAGDALDDDRGVAVDEDRHAQDRIFATARPAASYIDTVRSQYSTPYLRRIAKPSSSQAPGMRKIAMASAGSRPASRQPLITPRATMSTRVFDTTFIMTAIFLTPGFARISFVSSQVLRTLGLPPISQELAGRPPCWRIASKSVSEPPPAPITSPRSPSNSRTLPATPRRRDASISAPRSSNGVGGRASRRSSRPMPSSAS